MNDQSSPNHYHQPQLLEAIFSRLKELGKDFSSITRHDLSGADEFHLLGVKASEYLAQQLDLNTGKKVLDVGCGVGGASRLLAEVYECQVVGIDYTREYIRTAKGLSKLVGLDEKTTFLEGDALQLPFEDQTFDVIWTQHAQMNIEDKSTFYNEIKRVCKPGGQFLYYDIFAGTNGPIIFPVPWAEKPINSYLIRQKDILHYFDEKDWVIEWQRDYTQEALAALNALIEQIQTGNPPKMGLNLLMGDFTKQKLNNLLLCLMESKVEVHAGIFKKR